MLSRSPRSAETQLAVVESPPWYDIMPSTSEALRPASAMAFLIASTAMARVLRFDRLLYSVSPTPTMQYLSLSPAILPPREKKVRDAAAAVPSGAVRAPPR